MVPVGTTFGGDSASPSLRPAEGAVLLKVRAVPGASRDRVSGIHGDALKVAVTAPPEKGKANEAIGRVLASALGLRESQVQIHSGSASRDKWYRLRGVSIEDAAARVKKSVEKATKA